MTYAELKNEIIKIMKNMDAYDFQNAYEYACEWFDETPMYSPMAGLAYFGNWRSRAFRRISAKA